MEALHMRQAMKPAALVVEDDANQRYLIGTLLEECDMRVIECETGEAATAALEHVLDSHAHDWLRLRDRGRARIEQFRKVDQARGEPLLVREPHHGGERNVVVLDVVGEILVAHERALLVEM